MRDTDVQALIPFLRKNRPESSNKKDAQRANHESGPPAENPMKIIDDLLRIKSHRERHAESLLAQASRALKQAIESLQSAQDGLARAHAAHDAREKALYEDLFSRLVQLGDLDLARAELEQMHAAIKECELAVEAAEEERSKAEDKREEMRLFYRDAFRAREKYTELALQAHTERQRAAQFKEDMELEEVVVRRPDDDASSRESHAESHA